MAERKVYVFTPKGEDNAGTDWDLMREVAVIHRADPLGALYVDVHQRFRDVSPLPEIVEGVPSKTLRYCEDNADGCVYHEMVESADDFLNQITLGEGNGYQTTAYVNRRGNGDIEKLVDDLEKADFEVERVKF